MANSNAASGSRHPAKVVKLLAERYNEIPRMLLVLMMVVRVHGV